MQILIIAAESLEWTDKIQVHHPTWLFISLLVLLGFFAVIRLRFESILNQTLESMVSFQVAARIFNDNSGLQKQLDIILYVCYIFCTGILLYLAEIRFGLEPYGFSGAQLYFFNLGLLVSLFLARLFLLSIAGFLFNRISIFREYLYNVFIFNKLIGVLLLPLLVFIIYTDGFLNIVFQWLAITAVSAILILRIVRGFIFSFRRGVSIFYMFLYLCALEMAPLVLLYRWLGDIL